MEPRLPIARPVGNRPVLVDCDVLCRKCGYNLRALPVTACCPECNTPVRLSVRGDLLRFADPAWVEKVARGIAILLWMLPASMLAGVLIAVLGFFEAGCFWLLLFGMSIAYFCAIWLMTTPDPSGIGEHGTVTARKAIRFTLVAGVVAQVLYVTLSLGHLPEPLEVLLILPLTAAGLLTLAGEYVKFVYYEQLARRVPDDSLAWRARFLRWAFSASAFLLVAPPVVIAAVDWDPTTTPLGDIIGPVIVSAWLIVFLALVVFVVMTIFLLIRLRRALVLQAAFARATWAAALQQSETVPA